MSSSPDSTSSVTLPNLSEYVFQYFPFLRNAPSIYELLLGDVNRNGVYEPTVWNQLLITLVISVMLTILYYTASLIYRRVTDIKYSSPYLVEGTKDAKVPNIIYQNPLKSYNSDNLVSLRRSYNETDGLEFSYSWWMYVSDYEYKKNSWKHVFHKGNASSWPQRAPGVWLHPTSNSMYIYMNSYSDIQNETVIDNIPIGKWLHVSLVVKQGEMDVYINGLLKKHKTLQGIAKQNFGNVYINSFGGFSGYVSRLRYHDYAIDATDVNQNVEKGPDMELPYSAQQNPPYLTPNWWTNRRTST